MYQHYIEDPRDHAKERFHLLVSRFNQEIGKNYKACLEKFSDIDSSIASGAAAFLFLPGENSDRRLLIEAFFRSKTRDLTGEALVALNDYLRQSRAVREYLGQDWREWMRYPKAVESVIGTELDRIARVIGPSNKLTPDSNMADMLDEAEEIGLIDYTSKMELRSILGPNM